jgi:general secretion pathway protein G
MVLVNKHYFNIKQSGGFTLVELLISIAIIGLLAVLGIVAANYARAYAKEKKAMADVSTILSAVNILAQDANAWPGHQAINSVNGGANNEICGDGCVFGIDEAASGLVVTDGNFNNWDGPYMPKIPLDPWGQEYFFDTDYRITASGQPCDGAGGCLNAVAIGSYGPDGAGNNQYNGDDIINVIFR